MFMKKFDWLSPPITLYFKGENQHGSIFSGILSIICYILVFASGVYYALEFINRQNPKAYFFNRYIVDAGFSFTLIVLLNVASSSITKHSILHVISTLFSSTI